MAQDDPSKRKRFEPIETHWRNYLCRSRLEARWLVFLDAMGIEFEYEPEGFQIGAIRYLPDLHLPRVKMWGEVKPSWFTPQEESKATALVQSTGKGLLLLDSPPDFRAYLGYTLDCGEFTISQYSLDIWSEYNGDHKAYFQEHRLWAQPCFKPDDETQFSERYRHAVKAALRERFGR